ncbi:SRPBCC domain-containing protein [Rhodococcus opacus]|uniref:SRPBCC domain-containing protein n=1 Tax=Rhodococcus opacus TaxID=37919 RepID=UPI001C493EC0|nr:SRPBCC domain-containing protein [Rhodococcus opacus]MBV6755784.1 SRPBCC domain-containing protein [Rhodococcus opacus]
MNEIAGQDTSLTTVQRSMGNREIAEGAARTAVLRRRYDAPIDDVWNAITTPDRVDRFFLPLSGDLRAGGSFALQGQASGEILACDAPHLLRLQWTPPGDRGYSDQVEVRLTAEGPDATWLELEHASVADVFRNDPDTGCYGVGTGWEGPLHYLGEYLRGALPDRPSTERYTFDEAEELRLANYRGTEWAKVEAQHARSTGDA